MDRYEAFTASFAPARDIATAHGMTLSMPSDGCWQLRVPRFDWIFNMYGRKHGFRPRLFHDANRRQPFLTLPEVWDLRDVVAAAIKAVGEEVGVK